MPKKREGYTTVSVELPDDLHREASHLAIDWKVSLKLIVRRSLEYSIEQARNDVEVYNYLTETKTKKPDAR
jgi:predicted transcriptional regulator